ncbi:helix-turn-helix domain-containing protein [Spiroplasma endosymbiont of Melieria omissa]|uniref:helix-turn-helix domain-containing protein n=1 Tax=Spiroplasma endosymbiont of Melieria omissa TaxID=3139324 RepID=UPI003CCB2906
MPKPYSEDLRRKVIEAYESKNMKIKEICKVFNITRKTLFLWRKRKKETGHIKPILNYQKGHSHKIKDLDELKNYLAENKDVTVQKVIDKFGNMTKETVYNYFKKLNYTYKKNITLVSYTISKSNSLSHKITEYLLRLICSNSTTGNKKQLKCRFCHSTRTNLTSCIKKYWF